MKIGIFTSVYHHILYVQHCGIYLFRLLSISREAEFIHMLPLPMLKIVSAVFPSVWLFLYFWCVENWIMCIPSQHSSFPGKDRFCHWKQSVFIFFLSFSPSIYAFLVSLCAYFLPGFGTVKLLNFSRFGVQCHPKSLGLTGWDGGYWDMIQKAFSEAISQSDVNSRGGRIWQLPCTWTPEFTVFSLECPCTAPGTK